MLECEEFKSITEGYDVEVVVAVDEDVDETRSGWLLVVST
jgi:hypothetical protein